MFRSDVSTGAAAQFAADFNVALSELTFNSRPVISALTDLARENRAFAREVVDCLENRIRSVPPQQKLPILYALDSILKNVGHEYVPLAERNLFVIVTSVFDAVDDTTRASILHLLRTWSDTRLFQVATLDKINIRLRNIMQKSGRFVQALSSRDLAPQPQPQMIPQVQPPHMRHAPNSFAMTAQVMQQGYAHLAQAGITNPLNVSPAAAAAVTATALAELDASEVPLLSRLLQILAGSAAPVKIAAPDLLSQRATILAHVQQAIQQNRVPSAEAVQLIQQLQQLNQIRAALQTPRVPAVPPVAAPVVIPPVVVPPVVPFGLPATAPIPAPIVPVAPVAAPVNPAAALFATGASSLFASLQSALQNVGNPANAPAAPPSRPVPPPEYSSGRPDFRDPETLRKLYSSVVDDLYDNFKHRCSQCGLRFSQKLKLDDHLDWHFQQKRKEKTKVKKAFSRPWFVSAGDWQASRGGLISLAVKQEASKTKSDEESETEEKPNIVPANEKQPNCAGCGEPFEQYYDEEKEEWMFKDAVVGKDEKIYHPQCVNTEEESGQTEEERMARKRAHESITPSPPAPASASTLMVSAEETAKRVKLE